MWILIIRWIHVIIVIMFFTLGIVKVAEQSCSSLILYWCTLTCTRKMVCSSPVLLAAPLFNWGSRCWGSWIAVSIIAWIHVSTWMQASLQCKANKSVGHLCWTIWQLPQVVSGSLFELAFARLVLLGHPFSTTLFHLVRQMSWKHWPIRLNSVGPSSVSAMKYLDSNCAWLGATCLVTSRWSCCVPSIWHFKRLLCLQSI